MSVIIHLIEMTLPQLNFLCISSQRELGAVLRARCLSSSLAVFSCHMTHVAEWHLRWANPGLITQRCEAIYFLNHHFMQNYTPNGTIFCYVSSCRNGDTNPVRLDVIVRIPTKKLQFPLPPSTTWNGVETSAFCISSSFQTLYITMASPAKVE